MPDTQHPFSPQQSLPKLLSPPDDVDQFLMRCYLDACEEPPTPIHPAAGTNQSTTPDATPAITLQNNTPPPILEDIVEPTTETSPLRLTNDNTPTLSCPSPISEDPSTATFPTSQTSSCFRDFRQRYLTAFKADLLFEDFELLTSQFTAEAVELARSISSQQKPKPAPR